MHTSIYKNSLRHLGVLTAFCILMQAVRMYGTNSIGFIFLPYNLFLAWLPLLFSLYMRRSTRPIVMVALFVLWLLFFPNAPYIITDLLHLKPRASFPHWYDTMLVYTYAFTGLLVGMLSALIVYDKLNQYYTKTIARSIIMFSMLASGYGIFLGRFLRWNSWDAFFNPLHILADTAHRIINPMTYPRTYGVTLVVGGLLCITFLFFESMTMQGTKHYDGEE
jgi:uncharacterized membrane protein